MKQPKVAGTSPQMEQLEAGKTYAWCACGMSENQPWCNGAHAGSEFTPTVFQAEENKTAAMCLCKQSKNPPYCDGSHMSL
jgi:CDGSH-type Zn-finger protein|tara:strand:- start:262 stop:501 length:240 start_codon:yes stop_codon:yes gene_type:complete